MDWGHFKELLLHMTFTPSSDGNHSISTWGVCFMDDVKAKLDAYYVFFSGGGHLRPLEAAKSQDFGPFEIILLL